MVDELGDLSEREEMEDSEDEDVCQNDSENNLQEAYNSLLEDCGKYAKVANLAVKKMKKIEEEHKCILVQLKEAKCEVEGLKGQLIEAYTKIKFLELEIIRANVKVERISTKKLDNVLSSQKSSHDKPGLGYTGEGSSSSEPRKQVRFMSAKNEEKLKEIKHEIETPAVVKRTIGAKPKEKGNSLPKNQSGPQVKHVCHHYGIQGHTRSNVSSFMLSRRLPLCVAKKVQREDQKEHKLREIMRDISLETLWKC